MTRNHRHRPIIFSDVGRNPLTKWTLGAYHYKYLSRVLHSASEEEESVEVKKRTKKTKKKNLNWLNLKLEIIPESVHEDSPIACCLW